MPRNAKSVKPKPLRWLLGGAIAVVVLWFAVVDLDVARQGIHLRPDAADYATFFDGFWAQLVATAVGVILALEAERRFRKRAKRNSDEQADRDLLCAVKLTQDLVQRNLVGLATLKKNLVDELPLVGLFDTDGWQALSPELRDLVALHLELSSTILRLRRIDGLIELIQRQAASHFEVDQVLRQEREGAEDSLGECSKRLALVVQELALVDDGQDSDPTGTVRRTVDQRDLDRRLRRRR